MNEFIRIENINFKYEKNSAKDILNNISLAIKKGEFIALMGENGCGKSTLLKHFNALLLPSKGRVLIDNIDTKDDSNVALIRSKVGIVLQNPDNQIVNSIVEDDVAFGPENLGVASNEIRLRVDNALKAVGLYEYRESNTNSLSGGQKQRLAIAGVLAMNPSCILLDEPTSMLDPVGKSDVLNLINNLNKVTKINIILVTHDINEAVLADRIIVMREGSIRLDAPPYKLLKDPDILKKYGIELPEVTDLIYRLKKQGFNLKTPVLTVKDCVESIEQLLKGKRINND